MKMNLVLKKIISVVLVIVCAFTLFACASSESKENETEKFEDILDLNTNIGRKKMAVVYFSYNDDVKTVAEKIAEEFIVDMYEIEAVEPYTEEDFDKDNPESRFLIEDAIDIYDPQAKLPEIKNINVKNYDLIVLGFPVWIDNAPKAVYTFIKGLKNKIIAPFSVGGDMGEIDQYLMNFGDPSLRIMTGRSFEKDSSIDEIKEWLTWISSDFDLK